MTTGDPVFRVPKRKTSMNYELEIKRLMERVEQQVKEKQPTPEPTLERDVTNFRELFDEDDLHFALKFQAKQIFLGNQQIPSKSLSEHNVHFVIDTEPKLMLNIATNYVSIPMTEIMAIAFYKSDRLGFNHVMIMNLTSKGSDRLIEKQLSLKYRLGKYQDEGMGEDDLAIQKNSLFLVLNPHDISKCTKLGMLCWLQNPERSFQVTEGAAVRLLKLMKDKLERNCYVIEVIVEEIGNDEIDDIMETTGMSWLKTANTWQIRDRNHFLNMIPTLFMECTTHGVCELTEPDHPIRALARKKLLTFLDNVTVGTSETRKYSVKDRRASVLNNEETSTPSTSEVVPVSEDPKPTYQIYTAPEPEEILPKHEEEDDEPAYTVTYVDVKSETPISSILASLIADDSSTPSTSSCSS